MKKNIFCVALAVVLAFAVSSCGGEVKTNTDLLTIEKGWVLSAATSSPAYELSDGSFATDLIADGYLYDCELDEVITFSANGTQTINPGANICGEEIGGYTQEVAGLWSFNEDETILNMQIPFFYNDEYTSYDSESEAATILALNENELRVKYTFNVVDNPAKEAVSFTLTYVPVK